MTMTADQIAEYLQDHLDFFEQYPELVRELKLPTDSGNAISLVEFQLRKLRDHIRQLEKENDHMIETARINSVLFEKPGRSFYRFSMLEIWLIWQSCLMKSLPTDSISQWYDFSYRINSTSSTGCL